MSMKRGVAMGGRGVAASTGWLAAAAASHVRAARESLHDHRDSAMATMLAKVELDRGQHLIGPPSTSADLDALEAAVGTPLPIEFRQLLGRLGGAILYDRHELFGPSRVLVHDIEMVPDLLSLRAGLRRDLRLPAHLIPFHRADGVIHALDLSGADATTAPVVAVDGDARYPSLSAFVREVVLPRAAHVR
jgi:hypothetical protein